MKLKFMLSRKLHNLFEAASYDVSVNSLEQRNSMTPDAATIDSKDLSENLRIISLNGRMDIQGTDAVGTKFAILAASTAHRIVVDLTGVDFLASIGIRSLVTKAKAQQQRGGRMVLFVGDNAQAAKVLGTTGIDTLIPMYTDATKAQKAALA